MENKMTVSISYISAAANRFPQASAVSPSGSLIAFGSSNLVALWNIQESGIYQTLPGHESIVTCVDFIDDDSFVSGDDKGQVRHWTFKNELWEYSKLKAHEKGLSALCVHPTAGILVTGSSDAFAKVWDLQIKNEVQSLSLDGKYPLSMKISYLPASQSIILAIGTTDRSIQVWTKAAGEQVKFVKTASLPGHDDWVRCLSFQEIDTKSDVLVLASGSHDSHIRLWRIQPYKPVQSDSTSDALLDAFEASLGEVEEEAGGGRQVSLKRHIVTVKSSTTSEQYSITFDALLIGHEAGVTSLRWRPGAASSVPTLLSTSTDSSVIIWSPSTVLSPDQDEDSAIWINVQRFGDIGGQRLGGFIGGLWGQNGAEALAWGWSGGWRRWKSAGADVKVGNTERWIEMHAISGHSGPVKSLGWSPNGMFLASTGLDQTTRIHAPTVQDENTTWQELARPQVHGFDLLGVCFLNNLKFVSIGDEKVARVFEAPKSFVDVVTSLNVASFEDEEVKDRPMTAAVPPLGLSNKASSEGPQDLSEILSTDRPLEGELATSTLWPEVEKVFGHGYESITLAVSNARDIVASACKATSAEHAVVRLWDATTWQPLGEPLAGHALTVTRVSFSPNDKYVLSVSRDRTWRLFKREDGTTQYKPVAADKSHARIIWDCAWAHEGDIFATASRDKTVKIWRLEADDKYSSTTLKFPEAVTAVDFAPVDDTKKRLLAVGLETGEILVHSNATEDHTTWDLMLTVPSAIAHVNQIHRLSWRPMGPSGVRVRELASCSEDGSLRILRIQ